jgi:hypothetical protein
VVGQGRGRRPAHSGYCRLMGRLSGAAAPVAASSRRWCGRTPAPGWCW